MEALIELLSKLLRAALPIALRNISPANQHRLDVAGVAIVYSMVLFVVFEVTRNWRSIREAAFRPAPADIESAELAGGNAAAKAKSNVALSGFTKRVSETMREEIFKPKNPWLVLPIALMILAVFGHWPYNFYILARIIVCPSLAWLSFQIKSKRLVLLRGAAIVMAIIFNPIAPLHFPRSTWAVLNIIAALTLVPGLYLTSNGQENEA